MGKWREKESERENEHRTHKVVASVNTFHFIAFYTLSFCQTIISFYTLSMYSREKECGGIRMPDPKWKRFQPKKKHSSFVEMNAPGFAEKCVKCSKKKLWFFFNMFVILTHTCLQMHP